MSYRRHAINDASSAAVRCRRIEDRDLAGVIDLLTRGFPRRPRHYWSRGFQREAERHIPADVPRYGLMLESDGRPVGVILTLFAVLSGGDGTMVRCNLSSWYVDPAFRAYASTLVRAAVRLKTITYMNISPAPNTLRTIEAQGFRRYAAGVYVGVPSLRPRVPGSRIDRVEAATGDVPFMALPEADLLRDHAALGCLSLVVSAPDGSPHPFVFLPFRIRSGRVRPPVRQLIYCRQIADYRRFAGPLGRYLLWRGTAMVVHDTDEPEAAFIGRFFAGTGAKFFLGPEPPRHGDLAYTERVIFGP